MMKKILSLLLAALMLLTLLAACKKTSGDGTGTEPATEAPVVDDTFYIISDNKLQVRVICNQMEVVKAPLLEAKIKSICDTIEKKSGIKVKLAYSINTEYDADAYDIYIGSTGYPETLEVTKNLRLKDYDVVRLGNKLVIAGGDANSLSTALTLFLNKVVNPQLKDFNGTMVFTDENNTQFRAKYEAENISINGAELKDYTIVYPVDYRMAEHEIAYMLKDVISTKYGYNLPVETDRKQYDHEILIGQTARTTIASPNTTEYTVEVTDKNVQILAGCTTAYDYIDDLFRTQFLPQCKVETVKIDAKANYESQKDSILGTTGDIRIIFHNVYGGTNPDDATYTNPNLRWNLMSNLYTEYMADILCMQEFNSLPRTGSQGLESLLKKLGYEEVPAGSYSVNINYINGDKKQGISGYTITKGGSGKLNTPVFYNPEKVELIKSGECAFTSELTKDEINELYNLYGHKLGTRYDNPTTPDKASQTYWDYELYNDNVRYTGVNKSAVWAIFKDKTTGKLFAVSSVHFDHQDTCYSNARRDKESKELLNVINNEILVGEYANIPMFVGGDVNTSYAREVDKYYKQNNKPVGALQNFEAAGFLDVQKTFAGAEQGATCLGYANYDKDKDYFTSISTSIGESKNAIDHCLYKGDVTPTLFDIMNHNFARRTSDHVPLVVDFKFN